jgi:hypothetical protein
MDKNKHERDREYIEYMDSLELELENKKIENNQLKNRIQKLEEQKFGGIDVCEKCELLSELFSRIEHPTNRDYWIMTELAVHLHDGKDYCRPKIKSSELSKITNIENWSKETQFEDLQYNVASLGYNSLNEALEMLLYYEKSISALVTLRNRKEAM